MNKAEDIASETAARAPQEQIIAMHRFGRTLPPVLKLCHRCLYIIIQTCSTRTMYAGGMGGCYKRGGNVSRTHAWVSSL